MGENMVIMKTNWYSENQVSQYGGYLIFTVPVTDIIMRIIIQIRESSSIDKKA